MKLGLVEYVDCAHFLPGHPKCGRVHGHTYKVELVIEGENRTGMIIDFGELREILREQLSSFDHHSLNDFLQYPSVENFCQLLKQKLEPALRFPFILRVWEGKGKWAEL